MELVLTEFTWLPKELCEYVMLTEFTWLTQEIFFWVSIYQVGSANEGFSYFEILSSIELFVGSSQFRRWILIILGCIQADLKMCKI